MRIVLVLIAAILLTASHAAELNGSSYDEWLGIEGLRIVDIHHTEEYIAKMANISGVNETVWIEPGIGTPAIAGIWSFTLSGEDPRRLDLMLYQADGEVFGEGASASKDGTMPVTAAGNATFGLLDLRVVTLGDPSLIRLRLSLLTTPAEGSYAVYTPSGFAGSGAAFGYRTAPLAGISGTAPLGAVSPPS